MSNNKKNIQDITSINHVSHDTDFLIDQLRGYFLEQNDLLNKLNEALEISLKAHALKKRKNGEPEINHILRVAINILQLNIDFDSILVVLLHNSIADKIYQKPLVDKNINLPTLPIDEIQDKFGSNVVNLIEGVYKLDTISKNSTKRYSELLNLRKLLISSSKDVRILLIRLAFRLDNMRTISGLPFDKQIEYAKESLLVYSPLAEYVGIGLWKRELDDISFRITNPEVYQLISKRVFEDETKYQGVLTSLIEELKLVLSSEKLAFDNVFGRIKSVHSIYNKFLKFQAEGRPNTQDLNSFNFKTIKDFAALSIVLKGSELECYRGLGIIHSRYKHFPSDFKDYIAKPKQNGYRSIHTVIRYKKVTIEIQIKNTLMHLSNEFGSASHIGYKLKNNNRTNNEKTTDFTWVKELNKWSSNTDTKGQKQSNRFAIQAFSRRVYAITPKGKIIELKKGSTPIDFAYAIHTSIGNRCIGAKINGSIQKLDTRIKNGDIVEILVSKQEKTPNIEWLEFAAQVSTKSKIRHFLRQEEQDKILEGIKKEVIEFIYKSIKLDFLLIDSKVLREILNELNCDDLNQLYIKIYGGTIAKNALLKQIIRKLNIGFEGTILDNKIKPTPLHTKSNVDKISKVYFKDIGELDYTKSKCCMPDRNDKIVGIVTLRDGLKIHKRTCKELDNFPENRLIEASWL